MADTNLPSPSGEPVIPGNLGDATMMIDIEHELRRSYLGYAVSTLISRALPDVRDGFKPVQRRILYGMRGLGIGPGASRVKSARVVGEVMGKYHPHGDAAIYGTLVRLAQDFSLRYPLIDPQGNFGCFTGDTKIKMLDGTEKTFAELASLDPQQTFFVYSVDGKGNIVVGEGRSSRITRRAARLIKVTLDSGAQIRCTPDHRFMLRDGTYKEAQFLTPHDSLMPGYFDAAPIKEGLNEYLRVKQPSTGRYEFVHHIADAYNAERGIAPAFHGPYVRHHKNFNRFDNRPDNIERMEFLAYLHLHMEHMAEMWQSDEFRQAQREGVQRYYQTHPEVLEERRQRFVAQNKDEAFRRVNGQRVGAALKQRYAEDEDARVTISERMKALWADADYRAKMSEALAGVEKRPLSMEEKERVAQIISEKSRAMWADDAKRETITAAIISAMSSPTLRATLSANAQRLWQDPDFRAKYAPDHFANMARTLWADPATRILHRDTRILHREKMVRQRQNLEFIEANKASVRRAYARRLQANPNIMQDMAALSAQSLTQKWTDPEYKQRVIRQKALKYVATLLTEHGSDALTPQTYSDKRNANWIPRLDKALTYFDSFDEMVSAAHNYNHRIASVEWLEETADVYDITVNEHHNFLLADGVFVHNSVDGDPPAAQRYTECRMTPLAIEMLEDIERQTVEFMPNYDQSENEPVVLPGKFPNFLCNGGEGIAVGMSTSMAPHNLREVVDATLYFLDHPDATPDDLMKFVLAPDFPTAGLILGTKGAKEAYRTGRGRVIMQAQLQIEPMDNGKNAIVVTELPYQVNKAKLIEHIAGLAKEKRVDGITAINDFSDKHGMRMVIELRRDVLPKRIVNFLLKHSALRQTFGIIMLALVNGQPKMLNLAQIINLHVTHRREVITRRTRFELGNAKRRAHILEGMQIALDFLDEIIRIIRAASSGDAARVEMVTRFALTQLQAEAILSMQLRQIAQLERQKTEDEYRGLLREIARLEDILVTPARLTRMIKDELKGLRDKYGDDRRTRILPLEADQITEEDLIPEEKTLVTISRDGYIKRVPMDTYRTQKRGGKGVAAANLKDEDSLAHLFVATTTHMILFFTNRGRVYRLKAYEVPQTSRQARGQHINNFIGLEPGDQVTAILPMKNLMGEGYLFMATEYGEVKRTNLAEFANLRANGLNCFDLEEGDNLKWIKHTDGNQDALIVTRNGMSVRFSETDVPTRGRTAGGVRGIEMRDPGTRKLVDRVVTMDVVAPDTQLQLLVISENGLGKRTDLSKYNRQGRGGRGVKTMEVTNRTGPVVAAAVVGEDDKLMVISEKGVTIQTTIREIKETQSRRTQGVNVMNVGTGDRVVTIERLVDADEVAEEAEAAPDKDLQDVVVEPSVAKETDGGNSSNGANSTNGNGRSKK